MAKIPWQAGDSGLPEAQLSHPVAAWLDRGAAGAGRTLVCSSGTPRTDPLASPSLEQGLPGPERQDSPGPINPQEVEFSSFLWGMSRDVVVESRAEGPRVEADFRPGVTHSGQRWAF